MRTLKKPVTYLISFALLLGMIPNVQVSSAKKVSLSTKKLIITKGESKTLKVKNAKKKTTWKILSGKKNITLKGKGESATIKGRKKGTAKVQAKTGKISLKCAVTVKNKKKPENTAVPATPTPVVKNEQETAALNALIKEKRGRGATVSEDLDSEEYRWENGNLTYIKWNDKNLSGSLDTGAFVNLKYLNCDDNKIYRLDVSKNVNLTEFHCVYNQLTEIDVTNNVNLEKFYCDDNKIKKLDVTKNIKLTDLHCDYNQLKQLDVTNNINLIELHCAYNQLSKLDTINNVNLRTLSCHVNNLSGLYLNGNPNLVSLFCQRNLLSDIMGLAVCEKLEYLYCDENLLERLFLDENKNLKRLHCDPYVKVTVKDTDGMYVTLQGTLYIPDNTDNLYD